jgi:hypothetical protein
MALAIVNNPKEHINGILIEPILLPHHPTKGLNNI